MVSLILAFLFLGPRFIDFGDKPVANVPLRSTEVLVKEAGSVGSRSRFIYEIRADQQRGFPNPDQTEPSATPPSSASSNPSPARSPSTTTTRSATPKERSSPTTPGSCASSSDPTSILGMRPAGVAKAVLALQSPTDQGFALRYIPDAP